MISQIPFPPANLLSQIPFRVVQILFSTARLRKSCLPFYATLQNPSQQKVTLYLQFINVDFYIEFCFRNADLRMTLFIFSLYEICTESTIKTIKYCVQTVA